MVLLEQYPPWLQYEIKHEWVGSALIKQHEDADSEGCLFVNSPLLIWSSAELCIVDAYVGSDSNDDTISFYQTAQSVPLYHFTE